MELENAYTTGAEVDNNVTWSSDVKDGVRQVLQLLAFTSNPTGWQLTWVTRYK